MGRAQKDKNVIGIENLKVNYLSKKSNAYGDEILYFKVVDKDARSKLKLIKAVAESTPTLRMPFFVGDNNQIILKIKEKWMNSLNLIDFENKKTYNANLMFESYNFKPSDKDSDISGYTAKCLSITESEIQCV